MLSPNIVCTIGPDQYLILRGSVMTQLRSAFDVKLESGGLLLGCEYVDGSLDIDDATMPYQSDLKSKFTFVRRDLEHIRYANRRWRNSQGSCAHMGEWHTHPQAHPKPSSTDLESWSRNLPRQRLILVILGTLSVWIGAWTGRNVERLNPLRP